MQTLKQTKKEFLQEMQFKTVLSLGNRKLPKSTAIFNLPALKTCPNATENCSKFCYAMKSERIYPTVRSQREKMRVLAESEYFVDIIQNAIDWLPRKVNTLRIHESGDFYSQHYLNKWIELAKNNPSLLFYAYTKSFTLDYSERPKNFIIRLSLDVSSPSMAFNMENMNKFDSFTFVNEEGKETRTGQKNTVVCGGDCKKCSVCFSVNSKGVNVVFNKH